MLDFIHFEVTENIYVNNIIEIVDFPILYDEVTNKEKFPRPKTFNGMNFIWNRRTDGKDVIDISGSIHKFFNRVFFGLDQNFDDFTFTMAKMALTKFSEMIDLDLHMAIVKSFEFGVNIRICRTPSSFISKIRYFNKSKSPNEDTKEKNECTKVFEQGDTEYTFYDKTSESKLNCKRKELKLDDLLRFEAKFTRSRQGNTVANIKTLADFLVQDNLQALADFLQLNCKKFLIEDTLIPSPDLNQGEKKLYEKCTRAGFFEDTHKENFKGSKRSKREKRNRIYNKYVKLLNKTNTQKENQEFICLVQEKLKSLSDQNNELIEEIMLFLYRKKNSMEFYDLDQIVFKMKQKLNCADLNNADMENMIIEAQSRLHQKGL